MPGACSPFHQPHPCSWLPRSPSLGPQPPARPGERRLVRGGESGIFFESMSNFPPVYEPSEPRWLPATGWSVEIHMAAGEGGQHTGSRSGHRRGRVGGGRPPQTTAP